jgi:very-short-patch-repair endonuclease
MEKLHNRKFLKDRRKELRNNLTSAEATLWIQLQKKQLHGRKFRRQHSIGNYIVDFYCPSENLAIELDGEQHYTSEGIVYDTRRTEFLNSKGIRVIRFENSEILFGLEVVLEKICACFI